MERERDDMNGTQEPNEQLELREPAAQNAFGTKSLTNDFNV